MPNRRIFVGTGVAAVSLAGAYWLTNTPAVGDEQVYRVSANMTDTASPLGEMVLGREDAPVTMIEYASATCPHCANFHEKTFPLLKTEYIDTGKLRFVMREFPFDDLSLAAFMVARCAPAERYFAVIDVLFERQKVWTGRNPRHELFKIAKLLGMNEGEFDACLTDEKIAKGIVDVRELAQSKLGVNSTPTFFVNGEKITGNQSIGHFRKLLDKLVS